MSRDKGEKLFLRLMIIRLSKLKYKNLPNSLNEFEKN